MQPGWHMIFHRHTRCSHDIAWHFIGNSQWSHDFTISCAFCNGPTNDWSYQQENLDHGWAYWTLLLPCIHIGSWKILGRGSYCLQYCLFVYPLRKWPGSSKSKPMVTQMILVKLNRSQTMNQQQSHGCGKGTFMGSVIDMGCDWRL